jgi:hypothetical protein
MTGLRPLALAAKRKFAGSLRGDKLALQADFSDSAMMIWNLSARHSQLGSSRMVA